jgi:hypothetical protein
MTDSGIACHDIVLQAGSNFGGDAEGSQRLIRAYSYVEIE